MQIDKHNFAQHFYQINDHLHKASFVSFDCQFTGLVTNLQKIQGLFPDHRQFYQRIKQTALNFKIIQLGLTAFIFNQDRKSYEPYTYNFYTLPFVNVQGFNNVMISEVESLQFLSKHGMNWNRVLQDGITPQRLLKPFQYKRHNYDEFKVEKQYFFCSEDKKIVETIEQKLEDISKNNGTEKINFQKDSIYCYFMNKYNNELTLKKDKKTQKKFEYQVQYFKIAIENDIQFEKQQELLMHGPEQNETKYPIEQLLSIIAKREIPVIGFFPSLDLGLIYHTYFEELPQTFEQFCEKLKKIFPNVYDVKVISKTIQSRFKGLKANIKSLFDACFDPKILAPFANIYIDQSTKQMENSQSHEAGYDAYITGCAFIGMVNCLINNSEGRQIDFQELEKLTGMKNKIFSKHTGDILLYEPYCMKSASNSRKIVIWKNNKKNEERKEIGQFLSNYCSLSVYEDHNETYYVFEQERNYINELVEKLQQKYNVVGYEKRRIPKARTMYENSSQQIYFNP